MISANSPLDRYLYRDDRSALRPTAQRGMALFFSDRLACARCHTGFNLSGPTVHDGSAAAPPTLSQHGLYNLDGRGAYPSIDRGLFDISHAAADMGSFRAPTLRNIAVTAPVYARRQHPDPGRSDRSLRQRWNQESGEESAAERVPDHNRGGR